MKKHRRGQCKLLGAEREVGGQLLPRLDALGLHLWRCNGLFLCYETPDSKQSFISGASS